MERYNRNDNRFPPSWRGSQKLPPRGVGPSGASSGRGGNPIYRTRVCPGFISGTCLLGARCKHSHMIAQASNHQQAIYMRGMAERLVLANTPHDPSTDTSEETPRAQSARANLIIAMENHQSGVGDKNQSKKMLASFLVKFCQVLPPDFSERSGVCDVTQDSSLRPQDLRYLMSSVKPTELIGYLLIWQDKDLLDMCSTIVAKTSELDDVSSMTSLPVWGNPRDSSSKMCRFFRRGRCRNPRGCKFSHNPFRLSREELIRGTAMSMQILAEKLLPVLGDTATEAAQISLPRPREASIENWIGLTGPRPPTEDLAIYIRERSIPFSEQEGINDPSKGDMSGDSRSFFTEIYTLSSLKDTESAIKYIPESVLRPFMCEMMRFGVKA
ncbi:hypothetical protein QKR10_gp6 [Oberland virus]|uniref:C3H1-type domain-containing protein n=1 Tax=Oberland virus TaxID=2675849 RepID=A0A974LNB2_9MONO|nr:hypothetical protein QKR10_gp6 [Oberland virus]QGM12361.1 hypothetical protein [Oberland virus]